MKFQETTLCSRACNEHKVAASEVSPVIAWVTNPQTKKEKQKEFSLLGAINEKTISWQEYDCTFFHSEAKKMKLVQRLG